MMCRFSYRLSSTLWIVLEANEFRVLGRSVQMVYILALNDDDLNTLVSGVLLLFCNQEDCSIIVTMEVLLSYYHER
jgi:hypothetical protein